MYRIATTAAALAALALSACSGTSNPFKRLPPAAGVPGETSVPYGSQDDEDVTGAVSAVPMDSNESYHTVVEMLRTHVPGLQVTELPGGDVQLRIRGPQQSLRTDDAANQPLLVIDDMPILASALGISLRALRPNQIESIHVLKDVASTSIYGSRGANGVILIHTVR